ncbi:MAG: DUF4919 domain-containing protein [Parvibaculum sp.]|nr:DUF4919 domain-containing protein [Parvibaculum sp.]
MKQIAFILFCLLINPVASYAAEPPAQTYEALVAAAKRGDKPVDWTAIRLAYTKSKNYDWSGASAYPAQNAMIKAIEAKDYATAAKQANSILDDNYANMFAHRTLELVYGATGDKKLEQQYNENVEGIFNSIRNGGDGKSMEKSFRAVSIGEEYQMLTMLGLRPKSQSLAANNPDGHTYDVMTATSAEGNEYTVYFQIDLISAAEAALVKDPMPVSKE